MKNIDFRIFLRIFLTFLVLFLAGCSLTPNEKSFGVTLQETHSKGGAITPPPSIGESDLEKSKSDIDILDAFDLPI